MYETAEKNEVTMGEAQSILWNFGFWRMSKKEFEDELSLNRIDFKKEGLSFDEIVDIVTRKYNRGGKQNKIKEIFEVFDCRKKGSTSLKEIQELFHEHLEINVTDAEIADVFSDLAIPTAELTSSDFNFL